MNPQINLPKIMWQTKSLATIARDLLFLMLCLFPLNMMGQDVVRGIVSDETGEPIIGATVKVEGTSTGAVTDAVGNFSVKADSKAQLTISYVGYKSQTINVAGRSNLKIALQEDKKLLNDVVVIGYGTQRREAITGSVANINGEKLNEVAANNLAYSLQGRMPGVLMTQTSSQPGAEMQIRIRGQRSLTASNDPLIVLDGIPFMGDLSDINPNDIKSLDILKDASATAIYGSRGANGVIIVTTKKGMQNTPAKFTYNGYVGFKNEFAKYPMMDGEQFAALRKYAGVYQNAIDESDDVNTDWQDMFYQTGITTSHNINVAGGTTGGSYSFGAGYYRDESVVPGQSYDRYSIRGNFDQKVGDYFRFGLSTNTNYNVTNGSQIGLYGVLQMSPIANPFNEDGTLKRTVHMPLDEAYVITKDVIDGLVDDSWINEKRGLGSYNTMFAEIQCPWIKGLSYRLNLGLNFRNTKTGSFTGTGVNSTSPTAPNSASVTESNMRNWAVENILTYDRTFAEKHHLNIVGLYSAERTYSERTNMSGQSIPAEYFQYYNIGYAQQNLAVSPDGQNYWESGLSSWMGRVMYSYDNRYMLSATLRTDGSSRLAKGHKWHTYPAISAGWNIANEEFMQGVEWLNNLKLRVGYGETSNQSISPYSTLGSLSTRPYNFGSDYGMGYYVTQLPNQDLGWEYSKTWNFGLDFSLFQGRLTGTFEYYIQKTNDLLLGVSLPSTSGVSSYTANVGKTQNKGFEFSLNGIILEDYNGWNWSAGINFYQNRNKLVALASGADQDEGNGWFKGYPIDVIYDYKKIGLWQANDPYLDILEPGGNVGMVKVEYTGEYNEDGTPVRQIGPDDRQIISMEPDLIGGFNTEVTYKGFDFSVIGSFQIGGKLISAIHSGNGYLNMLTGRRGQIDVDYWTEDNTDAKYPKPGGILSGDNPKYASTLGYFDAGYLKIRTMTLGYSFENIQAIKNLGIDRMRIYATIQNPFVFFSPYKNECGLDPETNTYSNNGGNMAVTYGGHAIPIVGNNSPATRNVLFGINLTF